MLGKQRSRCHYVICRPSMTLRMKNGRSVGNGKRLIDSGAPIQEVRTAEVDHFGARHTLRYVRNRAAGDFPNSWNAVIQMIELGPVRLFGLPVELFVSSSEQINVALAESPPVIVAYANDLLGYAPPIEEFAQGGYETTVTLLGSGAAERLVDAVIELSH